MAGRVGRPPDMGQIRFCEENKAAILDDFRKLGKDETLKKWGISLWRWRLMQMDLSEHGPARGVYAGGSASGNGPSNGGNGHNGNGHNGNGDNGNGHNGQSAAVAVTLAATGEGIFSTQEPNGRLADLLRRMADTEGSTELARGLRLAATLAEALTKAS